MTENLSNDEGMSASEREALWNTIARVRDAAPRTTDDADTDDIIDAIIDSGWVHAPTAKAKAEALREAADDYSGEPGGLTSVGHVRWWLRERAGRESA